VIVRFIDDHRDVYGVEPICRVLAIAPSTFYEAKARQADPARRSGRAAGRGPAGGDRPRVAGEPPRLRRAQGVAAAASRSRCGRPLLGRAADARARDCRGCPRGADADDGIGRHAPHPPDLVQRTFTATRPNALWVADFTYVATWLGMVYVAFVIDVFSRRIVGWRASARMRTDLALDALEQALHARRPTEPLVHHSDRGAQYLAIRYTDRLVEAGVEASVGSRGDSYDNALAESVIGLYKTEVIRRDGPWRDLDHVEFATLDWVHWFNTRRLLAPLGYLPPAEFEAQHFAAQTRQAANVAA
jgi:putative transposase